MYASTSLTDSVYILNCRYTACSSASLLWELALTNWCYQDNMNGPFGILLSVFNRKIFYVFFFWVVLELNTIVAITVWSRLIWFMWEWWKLRLWKTTKITVRLMVMMRTQLPHVCTTGFCVCDVVVEKCVCVGVSCRERQLEITREVCHYVFFHTYSVSLNAGVSLSLWMYSVFVHVWVNMTHICASDHWTCLHSFIISLLFFASFAQSQCPSIAFQAVNPHSQTLTDITCVLSGNAWVEKRCKSSQS